MRALVYLVPFVVVLAACVAGVVRSKRDWPDWQALLAMVAITVAAGILIVTWRDPDVDGGAFGAGLMIGAVLLGGTPVLAYYGLGRALAGHRIALALLFVVSLAPLAFYLFLSLVFTWELVQCPPDAYECPL